LVGINKAALAAVLAFLPLSVPAYAAGPAFPSLEALASLSGPVHISALPELPLPARTPWDGFSGEDLFQALHSALVPTVSPVPSYAQAKTYMFSTAEGRDCGGAPGILAFYSQVCVAGSGSSGNDYRERGDQNGDGTVDKFMNAEHIWPRGFSKGALPMASDLHQLAPTLFTPNGRRANLRFAVVPDPVYSTDSGSRLGSEGFEPADAVKGNVARAVLYFVVRYYDRDIRNGADYRDFWTARVPMFLEWNRADPPDEAERRRNGLVESFQGNRNPFVDDPSLADRIGPSVFRAH